MTFFHNLSGFRRTPNPALERFIHEEFESSRHECVAVVAFSQARVAGICAFLQDMKVEFFLEEFPDCCIRHLEGLKQENCGTNVSGNSTTKNEIYMILILLPSFSGSVWIPIFTSCSLDCYQLLGTQMATCRVSEYSCTKSAFCRAGRNSDLWVFYKHI